MALLTSKVENSRGPTLEIAAASSSLAISCDKLQCIAGKQRSQAEIKCI